MHLSAIHLRNFKSFPNATLKLDAGFNSIVGPNGSGKSNVIDSLLFAFGESSLKSMRVKKTSDLIFGNNKIAEVTITLAEKSTSHTIGRAVKRDGKTKYAIDGKRAKKYAVEEFLSQNAVSLANVIKQGEVQRVVEVNSKERRLLIDIAANVSEYESKKREAMGELDTVEAKLREAATVLAEREGYLKELQQERENALKLKSLREEIDSLKATVLHIDVSIKEKEFESAINAHLDGENKLAAVNAAIRGKEAEILQINADKDEINKQISARSSGAGETLQREIDSLSNSMENAKKLIEEKKAEVQELSQKLNEKKLEKQRADDEVKGAAGQKSSSEKELAATQKILSEKKGEYEKLLAASSNFSQQFHDARSFIDKASDEMLRCKEKLTELQSSVSTNEEIVRLKEKELERLHYGDFTDFAQNIKAIEAERKKAEGELLNAQKELDALFGRERKLNERIPVLEDLILLAKEKSVEISSRLRAASDAPTSRSLEAVLALKEKFSGIYGTVEDLVTYSNKFAIPIQVAFGSRSSFVVVDSVKTASRAIDVLKERKLGRVSFIPLDKIHGQNISADDRVLAEKKGSLGFVIERVSFEEKYRKAIEYVCGNTIIMPDIKGSETLVGKIRFATMDGELAEGSGLVSGGTFNAKFNLAAERKSLDEWEEKLEGSKAEKDKVFEELQKLRDEMSASRQRKAQAELSLKTLEIQLQHLNKQQQAEEAKKDDATGAAKQLKKEAEALRTKISADDEERRQLIRQLSELNTRLLEAKQKIDVEKEAAFGTQLKERERAISELKVQCAEHENALKAINTQLSVYERQSTSLAKELEEVSEKEKSCRSAIAGADKAIKEGREALKEKTEQQKKINSAFSELINKREKLDAMVQKVANEKGKLEFERDRVQKNLNDSNVRRAVLETQLKDLKARFDEFKEAKVLVSKREEDKPELMARIKIIDADISKLGDVNLRAIELYDQRAKEFEEQRTKAEQLANEKQAVIGIINEIESKKIQTFMNTFNQINENFKKIFSKIFHGDGHLYLENPEKPFEGGLTIAVKLDNKEVKYLELMSGGEKSLIALIFIFALQSINPSSIYILDEPDAALDAENSRKLAELITALSKDTQFIVVSHNQMVYKNAKTLVGVAMAKGESKFVEVKLNE